MDSKSAMAGALVLAGLSVLLMGGVVFGLSSLYPVLYAEGVYVARCEGAKEDCPLDRACCAAQREAVVFLSSAALFAADAVMVVYGEVHDRVGPVACFSIGSLLSLLSLGALGLTRLVQSDALWFGALAGLGLAGPGLFMGVLAFGTAFPRIAPSIASVAAAAWDSSAVVFLLWALAARTFAFGEVVAAYAALCLAVAVATLRLLARALRGRGEDATEGDDRSAPLLREDAASVASSSSPPPPLLASLRRRDFVLLVAFMAAYNLKSAFYIESAADEARAAFPAAVGRRFDLFFDVGFPAGGLAASFLAALLLQRHASAPAIYYGVVAALANAFGALQLVPDPRAAYAAAALFGPARTIQWAAYFHYLESEFDPRCVGRLIGYGNLAIAVVGDGLPYVCAAYVRDTTSSKVSAYARIHGALCVAVAATSAGLVASLRLRANGSTRKAPPPPPPPGEAPPPRTLYVFDMDGTLLVSRGREIISDADTGSRAAIHPLIEKHVVKRKNSASSYAYCGEEDAHGDPCDLIASSSVIESVAAVLRRGLADPRSEVAVLTARRRGRENGGTFNSSAERSYASKESVHA